MKSSSLTPTTGISSDSIHLYVHIPFCQHQCHYCSFFTIIGETAQIAPYLTSLETDLALYQQALAGRQLATLYLGGGTPSLISETALSQFFTQLHRQLLFTPATEITLEANPENLDWAKLQTFRHFGITRLSLGLQAWQTPLLQRMNRQYTAGDFVRVFQQARQVGFESINVDVIFGYPGQSLVDWQDTLHQVIALHPDHIACYSLETDNQSILAYQLRRGKIAPLAEEIDRQMAALARQQLRAAGYEQYEISNFAFPGKECRHNQAFWRGEEYLGLGAGASSFFQGKTWQNTQNLHHYQQQLDQGQIPTAQQTPVTAFDQLIAQISLGLRTKVGINTSIGADLLSVKQRHAWHQAVQQLMALHLLQISGDRLSLTDQGQDVQNQVLLPLLASLS